MKYILFLLLSATCLAQNAKVTAYRLTGDLVTVDGPCSIVSYIKAKDEGWLSYVTAESDDVIFAQNLLRLKKKAKRWKRQDHFCFPRAIGGDMIHNMFVIEVNGKNDTILTTQDNNMIVLPDTGKRYLDEKLILKSTFPENIKEFFEHDFSKQIRSLFVREDDSITADKILYQERLAVDIFNAGFEQHQGNFRLIKEDSLYGEIKRTYAYNNDTIQYYKEIDITIANRDSGWDVGGFKPGDTEEALIAKYPASTKIQKYYNIRYEDIKRQYFYWVELSGDAGNITYLIKDHLIDTIKINLTSKTQE